MRLVGCLSEKDRPVDRLDRQQTDTINSVNIYPCPSKFSLECGIVRWVPVEVIERR